LRATFGDIDSKRGDERKVGEARCCQLESTFDCPPRLLPSSARPIVHRRCVWELPVARSLRRLHCRQRVEWKKVASRFVQMTATVEHSHGPMTVISAHEPRPNESFRLSTPFRVAQRQIAGFRFHVAEFCTNKARVSRVEVHMSLSRWLASSTWNSIASRRGMLSAHCSELGFLALHLRHSSAGLSELRARLGDSTGSSLAATTRDSAVSIFARALNR
jgi:hypothetical protein